VIATASPFVAADVDVSLSSDVIRLVDSSYGLFAGNDYLLFVNDTGEVQPWLLQEGQLLPAGTFGFAGQLRSTGSDPICCALAARYTSDELQLTPMPLTSAPGVTVARRLLVSSSGGFVRYVDRFTNDSPATQQFPIAVWTQLPPNAVLSVDSLPTATSPGYIVAQDAAGQGAPFAIVYSGVNPPLATERRTSDDQQTLEPTTMLTLAPGQSVILMHYVLLRPPADAAGAAAAADAVANEADPAALEWLTPDDWTLIANFRREP
jgi:hypothetical protein